MNTTRRRFLAGTAVFGIAGAIGTPAILGKAFAQASNTLIFAAAGTVTGSWDPSSHTVAPQITAEGFLFGRLTRCPMTPDNPGEILPDLALSWSQVDEHTLEYKLREGVTFHDGKPFTARDVKATYEYASDPGRPASAWYPGRVDVEVVDDLTVRLSTKAYGYPALNFWYVSSFLPILCVDDVANPDTLKQRPNGTGPFKYVGTNGDQINFQAFDGYHGGKPMIENLIWAYVPDANTRVLGLLNGQYHLTERLDPEQYASLSNEAGIKTDRSLSSENNYLHLRCNKQTFDD
ncbi:MAG: ABC transporter substrate-binding protein, partial [Hoeflea sp.]|nr:ABC transporter substrate-binding protein [Hoeflea sp.]